MIMKEKLKMLIITPKAKSIINFRGDLIKEIINKGYEVTIICPEYGQEEALKNIGVKEVIVIKMDKTSTSIINNIRYYKSLKNIIKKEQPDKIFAYTIKPVIFGCLAAKKNNIEDIYPMMPGLGMVYLKNDIKTKVIRFICGVAYKKAFKGAKRVIFQNSDDREEFIKRKYVEREKCEVVDGSGVNLERFSRNPLPEDNVFIMVSRLLKEKGVLEYCKAAEIVKEKYPDVRFLYLGAEDNTHKSLKLKDIEYYTNNKIIEYCGVTEDVPTFLKKVTVSVLPSYYREGIPRTLLEALAMGRPIITTNSVGCKETVKDNINGFIIPIKNEQILAEKMIYMIEHREELKNMSDESYNYCKERFDVNIVNKKMLQIMNI